MSALLSVPVETVSPFAAGSCTGACTAVAANALTPSTFFVRAADACAVPLTTGADTAVAAWNTNAAVPPSMLLRLLCETHTSLMCLFGLCMCVCVWCDGWWAVVGLQTGLVAVTDQGNGRYAVQYAQRVAGANSLNLALNSQPIALSPLPITITAGPAAAAQSSWVRIGNLTAGVVQNLLVTARDQFGNAVTSPSAALTVQITSGSTVANINYNPPAGNVFTFPVSFTLAGLATMYVRAGGVELPGSPFDLRVDANGEWTSEPASELGVGGH